MLVGFGCHCQYSLTAMNSLQKSQVASCQAVPIPDSPFELWTPDNRWLCFTVSYAQTFMQTIDHIWRCPAEHLPNALAAHAGHLKHANTIGPIINRIRNPAIFCWNRSSTRLVLRLLCSFHVCRYIYIQVIKNIKNVTRCRDSRTAKSKETR